MCDGNGGRVMGETKRTWSVSPIEKESEHNSAGREYGRSRCGEGW